MSFKYLRKLHNHYYFRVRIPNDLLPHFECNEIQKSLRTTNHIAARSQAILFAADVEKVFFQIRTGLLSCEQLSDVIRTLLPSRKKPLNHLVKDELLHPNIDAYIKEQVIRGTWTEKTRLEVENNLLIFRDIVGNIPLLSLDRKALVNFVDVLRKLPSNWNKKNEFKDKSILEVAALETCNPLTSMTVNKYIVRASSFLSWCVRQGLMERNPAEGLLVPRNVKQDEERSAYSLVDINELTSSLVKNKNEAPERFWVPLIGVYSGARQNEICQLYVEDVKEIDGVWCFDINDERDKRLKNLASKRMIPVHPKLVEIGFLDYVEILKQRGAVRLWENLPAGRDGYSHSFGKWYQRHNRQHITQDKKKCFHSFRHTVADTLKQEGVTEGVIAEILGHANQSITTGRYGKRYRPQVLLDALVKLNY